MENNITEFSHPQLNEKITAIGGNYLFLKEVRMPFNEKEVFYLLGTAIIDTSCCGAGGCAYVLVPGIIEAWKYRSDDDGRPVSRVMPIISPRMQSKIKQLILKDESVQQVNFL